MTDLTTGQLLAILWLAIFTIYCVAVTRKGTQ